MKKFLFYLSILIFVWCYSIVFNVADWDFWARITVGKIFLETGNILKHDFLAYTPVKDLWIDHEWGSGVVFWFLAKYFGDFGLLFLKTIIAFGVIFIITKIVELQKPEKEKNPSLLFYLFVYLGLFTTINNNIRCQLFSFLFFAVWLYVLERIRKNNENRLLWIFPATSLIWANMHGGFVAGLGLIFMYGIGEFLNKKSCRKYFYILIPSVLITLVNPFGIDYWSYIIDATTMHRFTVTEWQNSFHPKFNWRLAFWYKFIILAGVFTAFYDLAKNSFKYAKLDKTKYIVFLVCTYLSVKHLKHQSFYVITAASFFYCSFFEMFENIKSRFSQTTQNNVDRLLDIKDNVLFAVIITLGGLFILSTPHEITTPEERYPVKCVEFIKDNKLEGNLYSVFHWGSYLEWKLYPYNLVAVDGRYEEVFSNEVFNEAYNFLKNENGWYTFIDKYHTDILLIPHEAEETNNALVYDSRWQPVYRCGIANVFVRAEDAKETYKMPSEGKSYLEMNKYETEINFLKQDKK